MKAVLDIGSNSVRMIVFDGEKVVSRGLINSRLGEDLAKENNLLPEAAARTVAAIGALIGKAKAADAECGVFAFATEAARRAKNGKAFLDEIERLYGLKVDLLSGEKEAEIALYGVLCGEDGAVLDIGGASSELAVSSRGKIVYKKSLKTGAGVLTDARFNGLAELSRYLKERVKEYGKLPEIKRLYLIGGTASACAMIAKGLERYDYDSVDKTKLDSKTVSKIADELFALSVKERMERFHLSETRAIVLPCGAGLLAEIIEYISPEEVFVSERGNIEGYYFSEINPKR